MSLGFTYFGNSVSTGNTLLSTKTKVIIDEGYSWGNTIEYTRIGTYEVASMGVDEKNRRVTLDCENGIASLEGNHLLTARSVENPKSYHDDFDTDSFDDYFLVGEGDWSISSGILSQTKWGVSTQGAIFLSNIDKISDGRVMYKAKVDGVSGLPYNIDMLLRMQQTEINSSCGYMAKFFNNKVVLYKVDNNVYMVGACVSATFLNATYYYYMGLMNGGNISVYSSQDGQSFSKHLEYTDDAYPEGYVGLRTLTNSGDTNTYSIDEFEAVKFGNITTIEDYAKDIYCLKNDDGLSVDPYEKDFGFPRWYSKSGDSRFVVASGVTNGEYLASVGNITNGNSWSFFYNVISRSQEFVFEFDLFLPSGSSGNKIGFFFSNGGGSVGFYANYYSNTGGSLYNVIQRQDGTDPDIITGTGDHMELTPNVWNKVAMYNKGQDFYWFINGTLSNYIRGSSYSFFDYTQHMGIIFGGNGSSETTTLIKNPKVNYVPTLQPAYNISSEDSLSGQIYSNLWNYMESGRGNSISFIIYGTSRSSVIFKDEYSYPRSMGRGYDNKASGYVVRAKNDESIYMDNAYYEYAKREGAIGNQGNIVNISDNKIKNSLQAGYLAVDEIDRSYQNVDQFALKTKYKIMPEVGDIARYEEDPIKSGISAVYFIVGFNRYWNSNGEAYSNYILTENSNP